MGKSDDCRSLWLCAFKGLHPAPTAARGALRHITTGATLRTRLLPRVPRRQTADSARDAEHGASGETRQPVSPSASTPRRPSDCAGIAAGVAVALPGLAADEHKARQLEGFRLAKPTPIAVLRRKAAELDQPGLVRMQPQRELPEPFAHRIPEAPGVASCWKSTTVSSA
jgi:hypothetical protein